MQHKRELKWKKKEVMSESQNSSNIVFGCVSHVPSTPSYSVQVCKGIMVLIKSQS